MPILRLGRILTLTSWTTINMQMLLVYDVCTVGWLLCLFVGWVVVVGWLGLWGGVNWGLMRERVEDIQQQEILVPSIALLTATRSKVAHCDDSH